MQILKKKYIQNTTNNYLEIYQSYLKNFNYSNNFKKINKTLLKDIFLLKLDDFYLLNINLKENFFFSDLNDKLFNNIYSNNKSYLFYFLKNYDKNLSKFEINTEYPNYSYHKFFIKFLNKNLKKFYISKFFIKNNKKINNLYLKKINIFYPKLKGFIIKTHKKKKNTKIAFYGKIRLIKLKNLFKKKKISYKKIRNPYLKKKRYKSKNSIFRIFNKYFKNKFKFFRYNFKINYNKKDKLKFFFSRKFYIKKMKKQYHFNKYLYNNQLKYLKKIY